jgi:nucleoid-associated protein YgaU
MLALRRDVKLGLAISAGIVVAVAGIYGLLSMFAGGGDASQRAGATIVPAPQPGKTEPAVTPTRNPATPTVAVNNNASTTAANEVSIAAPKPPSRTEDPWAAIIKAEDVSRTLTGGDGKSATDAKPTGDTTSATDAAASTITTGTPADKVKPVGQPSLDGTAEHKIELGETFVSLAQQYYGDSRYYYLITKANPKIDPNRLKIGTVVTIPPMPKADPKDRDDTADVVGSQLDPKTHYKVVAGDSLQKIASKLYGDSQKWESIYKLNESTIGTDSAKLKIGMILKLPETPKGN